mgnify:CR=1 FL=1
MEEDVRKLLEQKIAQIEKHGHGEVVVKIRNGQVWRLLTNEDTLLLNKVKEE